MNLLALFNEVNPRDKKSAFFEVLIMLTVAFLLGYLLHWLTCRSKNRSSEPRPIVSRPSALAATTPRPRSTMPDDLKVVEGIGPKIEELLNAGGISTYEDLADASTSKLESILSKAGPRFQMHNPSTWAEQSSLARDGKWDQLEVMKDRLTSGRA
jgi:predicted flap endonuclease-1-like 5' DNA nuclease